MPKLPEKKTKKLAEWKAYADELGRLKARAHFNKLKSGKDANLKGHLSKFIDSIAQKIDPLELAASLGMTVLVKSVIDGTQELIERVRYLQKVDWTKTPTVWETAAALTIQVWFPYWGKREAPKEAGEQATVPEFDMPSAEIFEWLISFAVAYLIIKHGIDIGGGLLPLVKKFLGL